MPITLAEIALLTGGKVQSGGLTPITGAATLGVAGPGDVTLADQPDRIRNLKASPAAAAIVSRDIVGVSKPTVVADDVHAAFAMVVQHFRPSRVTTRRGVSKAAQIDPSAKLGEDVDVHPGASIGSDVAIGAGSTIHAGAPIADGCVVGENTTIFPNAVLYEDTVLGDRVVIHAGAVLGAYGFGYRCEGGRHVLSAQLGNVEIGDDAEIGAGATIDRGTYGPTVIGEGTKIDNLVMIAHNCRIGRHNLICSQVGIAGSATTGDHVVMAGQVGVRDHVHIGADALVLSKSGVSHDVAEGDHVLGQPATRLREQKVRMAALSKLPEMRRQFRVMQRQFEELQAKVDAADRTEPNDSNDRQQGQAA